MWKAYIHGGDPRPEISARLLKLVTVLNGNVIPLMGLEETPEEVEVYYLLQDYALGFAQSISVGEFDIEIVLED